MIIHNEMRNFVVLHLTSNLMSMASGRGKQACSSDGNKGENRSEANKTRGAHQVGVKQVPISWWSKISIKF